MSAIKLKKGYDLNLRGKVASQQIVPGGKSLTYAVIPDDFTGIVPRLDKKEGERVLAGEAIYHDKTHEAIMVTSPVSGTVKAVCRGERRKITAIVIQPDGENTVKQFDKSMPAKDLLLASGLWTMMRQRPYDVVPNPDVTPRDIFVTGFDSAPLAPSLVDALGENEKWLEAGLEALATLTTGKVHVCYRAVERKSSTAAEVHVVDGPHPAGNAGVQAANIKPVNKGETIWTLDILTAARFGRLVATGVMDYSTIVAVTGSEVKTPQLVKTVMGCSMLSLLNDNIADNEFDKRIISGNVLTGVKVALDGYLRAPYRHVTVIPEVNKPDEFMGWGSLSPKRFSIYRLFPSWLLGNRQETTLDARLKGGERAIVRCDEYDDMLPMDIYAEFLIKAIIAFDIDKMEKLGVYEIAPEDFALAEFADTSKLELQRIVREGLDKLRAEME